MEEGVRLLAPCKVNLHLAVGARRSDGYHGILSLFQAASLADVIQIRSLKERGARRVHGLDAIPLMHTTVYKAAEAFFAETGIQDWGFEAFVDKRVPSGAGLGGGSSDAAVTLLALNQVFRAGLTEDRLLALASQVGSDVPFFIMGGAAIVEGRGEFVSPVEPRLDYELVIVFPGRESPTGQAYAALDASRAEPERPGSLGARGVQAESPSREELLSRYQGLPPSEWGFFNSFQPCVEALIPECARAREDLLALGADLALLSGSGSSVFGVFSGGESAAHKARSAAARLASAYPFAFPCSPLARPIGGDYNRRCGTTS
jgi:4-diphosphocytidyl-2-C-methyl-D-erythritol kinase